MVSNMTTLDEFQNKLFSDGEYTVWSEKADEIKQGDTIYLTTSKFEYDCVYGCFMKDLRRCAKVKLKVLNEDLSEYVQGKHIDGGAYAYAAAEVQEVIEVGY